MRWTCSSALAMAAALVACSDEPVGQVPTAAERDAARALVDQIGELSALPDAPRDSERLLTAASFGPVTALLAPAGTRVVVPSRDGEDNLERCTTTTARTASFAECSIAEHVVDGTVSRQGYQVTAELDDVFLLDPGLHGAASVDARLATGPGPLAGVVDVDAQWTVDGQETTLDATVHLDQVALDDSGCPVGGAMDVAGELIGPGIRARRTIRFGPACGDLVVSR
jgi:hypothetical protein